MSVSRVYVDSAIHPFGRMLMCHMVSPDLVRLHMMAAEIGVARRWFQDPRTMPKVSHPHYDICKSKRALAVRLGAVECDRYQFVAIVDHGLGRPDPLRIIPALHRKSVHSWLLRETGISYSCAPMSSEEARDIVDRANGGGRL